MVLLIKGKSKNKINKTNLHRTGSKIPNFLGWGFFIKIQI